MDNCPTCGGKISADELIRFDAESNVIVGNGRAAVLTDTEMELMLVLKDAWPRVTSKDQILARMYSLKHEEPETKIVDVFVCKVRKKIKGLGVSIKTEWGSGLRLVYDENRRAA